jgi:hypothetical protein
LAEPLSADALTLTLDLWSDNYVHRSYLDIHAFWVDKTFNLKNCILAVRHFGTERHTGGNISALVQAIMNEFGLDLTKVTTTTDKGSNVVSALF